MNTNSPFRFLPTLIKLTGLIVVIALVLQFLPVFDAQARQGMPKAHPELLQLGEDNPDAMIPVIIQKDRSKKDLPDAEPEQELEELGGKVKKKFEMFDSFSAELSGRELEKLAKHNKVRWISLDAPMFSSSVLGTNYALDVFNLPAYSGNNGSSTWVGNWQEAGENDGPSTGLVKAVISPYCMGGGCLAVGGSAQSITGHGASRQIDLSHTVSARLSFTFRRVGTANTNGVVLVQVSADGGNNWIILATYNLGVADSGQIEQSFNISTLAAPNTQVRFIGSGSTSRTMYIDNIQVEYTLDASSNTPQNYTAAADLFSANTYAGSAGSYPWKTNWTETDAAGGGSTAGNIKVEASTKCASGTGYCLMVGVNQVGDAVSRSIDLSGAASAQLSLYRRNGMTSQDNDDAVSLEVSANGSSWINLRTWHDTSADLSTAFEKIDLTPFISPNTQIRFIVSKRTDAGQVIFFDNIEVQISTLLNTYNRSVGLDQLWEEGLALNGAGVTVAVVDSGVNDVPDLGSLDGSGSRIQMAFEANGGDTNDGYGHGTHVTGILAGNGTLSGGQRTGIAPQANLINVKVSDANGMSLTSDVIDGLQWVYQNKDAYNIRVVNLSLNSSLPESYQTSALDAACEILWFNGIVVVAAAGNNGSATLYPPANDPFVITVGATDEMSTASLGDDAVAPFSAYGMTEDGFAKPDLVAPGRNIISLLASAEASIYYAHPDFRISDTLFRMSGTSMSAPMVSGAAALLLQDEPNLTPDQVKFRLKSTANKNWPGYDTVRAGAGYLDIYRAVHTYTDQPANTGLTASKLLSTGSEAITWDSVAWNSVAWNSVAWNSVAWNSVAWNSVAWNSVAWNSDFWGE